MLCIAYYALSEGLAKREQRTAAGRAKLSFKRKDLPGQVFAPGQKKVGYAAELVFPVRAHHRVEKLGKEEMIKAKVVSVVLFILLLAVGFQMTMAAELKVGDPVPPFRLIGSDGEWYTPEQFLGVKAMVISWFPKAFTGG